MDIPDYFTNPNADKNEWIKQKVMSLRWELRRTIEEVEYTAELYQTKKNGEREIHEVSKLEEELRKLLERTQDLAIQIRDLS